MRLPFMPISAVLLLLAASGGQAQGVMTHCVPIEDAEARLACFDAATRGPQRTATDAAQGTAAPSPAGPAVAASANAPAAAAAKSADAAAAYGSEDFGLSVRKNSPEKITATVRSVASHTVPGRWVVTLDNEQIWEQRETTAANRRPKPGDSVTIEQSSLGSYLMITAGRGASRVKRIR